MGNLIFQPLLREGFQETSEVTTSDISQLQAQITELGEDVRNKVPKFFAYITELEAGEIGEYHGTTNNLFTEGYFYKNNDGGWKPQFSNAQPVTLVKANQLPYSSITVYTDSTANVLPAENINIANGITYKITCRHNDIPGNFTFYLFPIALGLASDLFVTNQELFNNSGYLLPYGFYDTTGTNPESVKIPLVKINDIVCACYDGQYLPLTSAVFNVYGANNTYNPYKYNGFFYKVNNTLIPAICFQLNGSDNSYILPVSENNKLEDIIITQLTNNLSYWTYIYEEATKYTLTYTYTAPFLRVDTQPATDPAQFATAAQGEKADTALQSIAKGTDGSYITTNVGAKNANKVQTVSAELTIQAIADADADHKGLAEAKDVKDYVDTYINNITIAQYDTLNDYYTLTLPTA